ncbi:MAG: phosphoadenylyl-sulfate reductase [Rhizobiales bacterium]|nr:phosphoadenylyl-sulfate reductase [Hyphomicrobiales bacterium]
MALLEPAAGAVEAPRLPVLPDAGALNSAHGRMAAADAMALAVRELFPGRIALVSSFGAESAVLLHLLAMVDRTVPVVFLDTGRLFAETLQYRTRLTELLGLTDVRTIRPDPERVLAKDPHRALWMTNPDLCCHIRKTEPLRRAIEGFDAWFTGRKRFQNAVRANLPLFEAEGPRIKVNPLADWSSADLAAYAERHGLPAHPLMAEGYPSIGCVPCTSRVRPGEDGRAGRWRGLDKTECGIHVALGIDGGGAEPRPRGSDTSSEASMPLWKDGKFLEDSWTAVADDAPLPEGRAAVSERDELAARNTPLALLIPPGSDWRDVVPDLARFPVIVLPIEKYGDGRAYSIARLLRERDGYKGELRVTGPYIIDQVPLMRRCGIDAFETNDPILVAAFERGVWPEVKEYLQPAIEGGAEVPAGTRPWQRRRRAAAP